MCPFGWQLTVSFIDFLRAVILQESSTRYDNIDIFLKYLAAQGLYNID